MRGTIERMGRLPIVFAVLAAAAIAGFLLWPRTPFAFLEGWEQLPKGAYVAGDVAIPANAAPDIYIARRDWKEVVDVATVELKAAGFGFVQGAGSQAINFISESRRQVSLLNDVRIVHRDGKNFNEREKGWVTVQIHEKPWP